MLVESTRPAHQAGVAVRCSVPPAALRRGVVAVAGGVPGLRRGDLPPASQLAPRRQPELCRVPEGGGQAARSC